MRNRILIPYLCILLFWAALSLAEPLSKKAPTSNKLMSTKILDGNAWKIYTSNYGPFINPPLPYSGGYWPTGTGHNYIFGAGLWVGAIDSKGDTVVAVGYNPHWGNTEFGPIDTTHDWTDYSTDPSARVFLSTSATDLAEWQIRDDLGNPVVKSNQDGYALYNDQNPAFTYIGDSTLNIEVCQTSYCWNTSSLHNIVYFNFSIKNISGDTLDSVYISPCIDADIGNESDTFANDRTTFDYNRNLAIQFQNTNEPGWDKTGVVGFRLLSGPKNNTGQIVHITDNKYSHDIQPGVDLGLTAFKVIVLEQDPLTDKERYMEMSGKNWWDLAQDAYDEWGAFTAGDKRFIMSSGPFMLTPNESVNLNIAFIAAYDTFSLKSYADTAIAYFYDYIWDTTSSDTATIIPDTTINTNQPKINDMLLSNEPNPFNSSGTTINYQIGGTETAPVCLKIYNIAGQLVKTLVNDSKSPGYYSARWNGLSDNGQKVSAGIYIYRLQAGDESITKKMVLIK